MASTGPDIKKAYDDLFSVGKRITDDGSRDGIEFGLGAGRITMEALGPDTLHVIKTFQPASGRRVDIIFDRTRVPKSFADAEAIETLALSAVRTLLSEKIQELAETLAPL